MSRSSFRLLSRQLLFGLGCSSVSFYASDAARLPYISRESVQKYADQNNQAWTSYSETVEFLPAASFRHHQQDGEAQEMARQLEQQNDYQSYGDNAIEDGVARHADDDVYKVQPFAYGEVEYDEYQQAWRMLGFMIDCRHTDAEDDDQDEDEGTGEGCHRYVLWAAYVDLEYEGGGIGEYQFWDRSKENWNDATCVSGQRCAKMDCHLKDTHYSLLGFFKHRNLDDWMEQLFKHEGMCVWSSQEYAFMKNAREAWPEACVNSYTTTEEGGYIYYDIKPISGGGIKLGLYTDTACVEEYKPVDDEDPITVENILGNFIANNEGSHDNGGYYDDDSIPDFSSYSLEESLDYWHNAMGAFRICQPCVAYDLNNVDGCSYGYGDPYDCYDDADYTNVNQCMKFMAKTTMKTATFRDLNLARTQGTLSEHVFSGSSKQSRNGFYRRAAFATVLRYLFLIFSMYVFYKGVRDYLRLRREASGGGSLSEFKEPLANIT